MNIAYAIDNSKQDIAHVIDSFVITSAMDTLGKRIKNRREELQLDQIELARKAGISQPTLANLESGKNERTKFLAEIARALNVSVEWLDTGRGQKETHTGLTPVNTQHHEDFVSAAELMELNELYLRSSPATRQAILALARHGAQMSAAGSVRFTNNES